jgi:tetratricopeptide (TPR) repeat protein
VSSKVISFSWVLAFFIIYGCGSSAPGGEDLAVRAYLDGDLKGAEKLLRAEITVGKVRSSRHLLLGRVCFLQKKWDAAGRALKILLEQDADNPQGRELLGRTLFRQGQLKKAEKYYRESLGAAPRAELRLEYGELFIGLGRKPEAIVQLNKVLADSRRWPRAHYLMGCLRLDSGQGHWAARHLWVAFKLGCPQTDLIEKLPRAFFLEGRVTGPLQLVGPLGKEARAGDRNEKHLLLRSAGPGRVGYWYASGPDTAIYQAERALGLAKGQKDSAELKLLVARCWLMAGNLKMAARKANGIDAAHLKGFRLLAEIVLSSGDLKTFEVLRKKPPGKTPEVQEVLTRLTLRAALIAQVDGQLKRALALLEAADLLMPGRSDVLRPTVDVLERLGRGAEAAVKARLLIELHPDSPEIRLFVARYRMTGEKVEQGPIIREDSNPLTPQRGYMPRRGEL